MNCALASVARQSKVGWRGRRESALCQSRRVSRDLSQARGESRGRVRRAGAWWRWVTSAQGSVRDCAQNCNFLDRACKTGLMSIVESNSGTLTCCICRGFVQAVVCCCLFLLLSLLIRERKRERKRIECRGRHPNWLLMLLLLLKFMSASE